MRKRARDSVIVGCAVVVTSAVTMVFLLDGGPVSLKATEGGALPPRSFTRAGTEQSVLGLAVDESRIEPTREHAVISSDSRRRKQLAWLAAAENPQDSERRLRNLILDGQISKMRLARLVGDRDRVSDQMAAAIHTVLAAAADADETLRATLIGSFYARKSDRQRTAEEWETIVANLSDRTRMDSALDSLPLEWTDRSDIFQRVVEIASGNEPEYLRVKAVQLLASTAPGESAAMLREVARGAESLEIEAAAIRGLIGDSDPETLDVLREVMTRPLDYGPTARFAVRALGEFAESAEATSLLIKAYRETVDPAVQSAALHALASHAAYESEAWNILIETLEAGEVAGLQEVAAFGLMRSPDVDRAIRAIEGCIGRAPSEDTRVRLRPFLRALEARR